MEATNELNCMTRPLWHHQRSLFFSFHRGLGWRERYEHDSLIALHFFLNIIISPFNNWLKASCLSSARSTFRITASRGHRLKLNAGKSAGQFLYRVTSRYIITVSSQRRDSTSIRMNLSISHLGWFWTLCPWWFTLTPQLL